MKIDTIKIEQYKKSVHRMNTPGANRFINFTPTKF